MVLYKVVKGGRPCRPRPGFSGELWGLLMATWVEEHAKRPHRRPPASTILDQLKGCVDHWEGTIVPLVPERWQSGSEFIHS